VCFFACDQNLNLILSNFPEKPHSDYQTNSKEGEFFFSQKITKLLGTRKTLSFHSPLAQHEVQQDCGVVSQ
jgi:hypothetical protein